MPDPGSTVERIGRQRLIPAALVVLAIALRLAALLNPPPLNIDEARYLVAAHHLETGAGYSDWRGPETHIHPLHPWLTSWGGGDPESLEFAGRVTSFLPSLLLLIPLSALATRMLDSRAGLLALLLTATHPWLVRAAAPVQPESLYVLLAATGLYLISPGPDVPISPWRWGASGVCFGLSYLARPEGLLVGLLAGGIALVCSRRAQSYGLAGAALFLTGLILAASPYLLFLRAATGGWTVTGKTSELFFVGQALRSGQAADPLAYVAMRARWGTILNYAAAHPGVITTNAGAHALRIWGWIVPRGLGPAGLLGFLGFLVLLIRRRRDLLGRVLLVASPCLTLFLMLFTFPNERVVGSVVPFLLVIASVGLSATAGDLLRTGRRARIATLILLLLVASSWGPAALRAFTGSPAAEPPALAKRAAGLARKQIDGSGRIATNNPLVSFYAGDPVLFGPPGKYRPLEPTLSCAGLAASMRGGGESVAVIDLPSPGWATNLEDCPLHLVERLSSPAEDRVAVVLILPRADPATGPGATRYH